LTDQREMDKIELRVLAEEWSEPTGSLSPAQVPKDEMPPIEPPAAACAPEKPRRSYALAVTTILLLGAIVLGPSIGLLRVQVVAAIADKMNHQSKWYGGNRSDLASAYMSTGNSAAAEQVYRALLAEDLPPGQVNDFGLNRQYAQLELANLYRTEGKHQESAQLAKLALTGITAAGKIDPTSYPSDLTRIVQSFASFYDSDENPGKHADDKFAIELYEKTLALWKYAPGSGTKSNVNAALARLYEESGQHQLALDNYISAYNVFKENGDTSYNAYRLEHIGLNMLELHQYAQAEPILEQALSMTKLAWNEPFPLISSQINLARAKYELHKYGEAKTLLESALADSYKFDDGTLFCWNEYYLAKCASATGDVRGARVLYENVLERLKEKYDGPSAKTVQEELKSLTGKTIRGGHT